MFPTQPRIAVVIFMWASWCRNHVYSVRLCLQAILATISSQSKRLRARTVSIVVDCYNRQAQFCTGLATFNAIGKFHSTRALSDWLSFPALQPQCIWGHDGFGIAMRCRCCEEGPPRLDRGVGVAIARLSLEGERVVTAARMASPTQNRM